MFALPPGADELAAARAGSPPAAVHRTGPPSEAAAGRCGEVGPHVPTCGGEQVGQTLVAEIATGPPRVEGELPERFALVHVADPAADPLVKQELTERDRSHCARPCGDHVEREVVGQDVRAQMADRLRRVSHELDGWCPEEHGLTVAEFEDGSSEADRPSPRLPCAIYVPGARHAQV